MVVGTAPLVVAAYTDELDCTALLKLPDWVCQNYAFVRGTRLLTANSYSLEPGILTRRVARDLTEGPASLRNYSNFYPILIDLISADTERMAVRREEISEDEWARCEELGQAQFDACGGRYRDGRPARCGIPA